MPPSTATAHLEARVQRKCLLTRFGTFTSLSNTYCFLEVATIVWVSKRKALTGNKSMGHALQLTSATRVLVSLPWAARGPHECRMHKQQNHEQKICYYFKRRTAFSVQRREVRCCAGGAAAGAPVEPQGFACLFCSVAEKTYNDM